MCDLCKLEKKTEWFYEDDRIVVFLCKKCKVPVVTIKEHRMNPGVLIKVWMKKKLIEIGKKFYGHDRFVVDKNQRSIKDHLHWHARELK